MHILIYARAWGAHCANTQSHVCRSRTDIDVHLWTFLCAKSNKTSLQISRSTKYETIDKNHWEWVFPSVSYFVYNSLYFEKKL